jgi:hypothetical protein
MRFCWQKVMSRAARRRFAIVSLICAVLPLYGSSAAEAQGRIRRGKIPKAGEGQAAPEKLPPGMNLTKSQAVFAVIQALAVNQTPAARETLEQIVEGKIPFGAHNKQAAQTALVALASRPSSDADAFFTRIFTEPDDKLRPGDPTYNAATLRYDTVRVLSKIGSPQARVGMAKIHDQSTQEIRAAIQAVLLAPFAVNFPAQVVLVHSRAISDTVRTNLKKLILAQNAEALKQALKLSGDAPTKDAAQAQAAAAMAELGKLVGGGAGGPAAGPGSPGRPGAGGMQNPVERILNIGEKAISAMPADSALVARTLWQTSVVEELAAQLATDKMNLELPLEGLGSIPLKAARERMRDYLLQKLPRELGKVETAKSPSMESGPAMGRGGGGGGRGRRGGEQGGMGGRSQTGAPQSPAFVVGADWLDPGTVLVLKSLPYKDRPKTRHKAPTPPSMAGGKHNPAAEKKAEELAEKQRQTEMQYEWRDTLERFVSHWDDRLGAVAAKHEGAEKGGDTDADPKEKADKSADKKAGGTKASKRTDSDSKKSGRMADAKAGSESKSKSSGTGPTPSVPMPFALRPGEHITKEFHLRWPEDLPANLTAAVSEPLVVHYVELEGTDDMNRTATFYRSAYPKEVSAKGATRDIQDGKWVDILQRDPSGQRMRSLDVLITRQPSEKKSKVEELTVQVLMVEVESFGPDPKPTDKSKSVDKEQAKSDSP